MGLNSVHLTLDYMTSQRAERLNHRFRHDLSDGATPQSESSSSLSSGFIARSSRRTSDFCDYSWYSNLSPVPERVAVLDCFGDVPTVRFAGF